MAFWFLGGFAGRLVFIEERGELRWDGGNDIEK